jgi:6-phosphogluconolactonase
MIRIFNDSDALSRAAAELIASRMDAAVQSRGEGRLVLSGGQTPMQTYALLAQAPFKTGIPWGKLEIFWGDERCVPPGDERHNGGRAHDLLLDHVRVSPERVHPIICNGAPRAAAQAYDLMLHKKLTGKPPRLDVTLLGLGAEGHTASLFPGTPILGEEHRWAAEVHRQDESITRVSMTPALLNQSRLVIFLVSGGAKAAALKGVLHGPYDPQHLPAQSIRPQSGECLWLADEEAAAKLGEGA